MIKVCEKYFLSSLHRPFLGALYCFFYQRVRNLAYISSWQLSATKNFASMNAKSTVFTSESIDSDHFSHLLYVVKESGQFSCRGFRCLNV